jgi:hypothetical protein
MGSSHPIISVSFPRLQRAPQMENLKRLFMYFLIRPGLGPSTLMLTLNFCFDLTSRVSSSHCFNFDKVFFCFHPVLGAEPFVLAFAYIPPLQMLHDVRT